LASIAAGLAVLAIFVTYTWDRQWDAPLPNIHASGDPEVIRRGEYLVFGPAHCSECHTKPANDTDLDVDRSERPPLVGGRRMAAAPLGAVYAKNLTPDPETGIGRYTDAQIGRMLRWSVRPNGRASLQLLMPFGNMSDADLTAIVSFLRSQPPVRHAVPENEMTLIGKVVKSLSPVFKPRRAVHPPAEPPAEQPTRERGEYVARSVANCGGCHTKHDPLSFAVIGPEFAGGTEMEPEARPRRGQVRMVSHAKPDTGAHQCAEQVPGPRHVRRPLSAGWVSLRRLADAVGRVRQDEHGRSGRLI
jgi:mono/diheme cytochrome c family protein